MAVFIADRTDATANRLVAWLSWDCCANSNKPN